MAQRVRQPRDADPSRGVPRSLDATGAFVTPTALVVIALIVSGAVLRVATLSGPWSASGEPVGGDFICFYPAAHLVLEGRGGEIYDAPAIQAAQQEILGPNPPRIGAYQYPPTLAIALSSLAWLPFHRAYAVYTLLQFAAVAAAVIVLRDVVGWIRRRTPIALALALCFAPIHAAAISGQNTAISLLLVALFVRAIHQRRCVAAGIWLGVLAFKPQFAAVLLPLLLAAGQWRVVGVAAGVCFGHYLLGAAVAGAAWPAAMLDAVRLYWPLERAFNGVQSISVIAVLDHLGASGGIPAATALALAAGVVVRDSWRRGRAGRRHGLSVALAATLLISPHTLWYDAGLLWIAGVLVAERRLRRWRTSWTDAALPAAAFVAPLVGVTPLGVHAAAVGTLLMLWWLVRPVRVGFAPNAPSWTDVRAAV